MNKNIAVLALASICFLACSKPSSFVEMVDVEGGVFLMGAHTSELDWATQDDLPAHMVRLSDYKISKYEITVGQFKTFVDETGYVTLAERRDTLVDKLYKSWIVDTTGGVSRQVQVDSVISWRNGMFGQRLTPDDYDLPVAMVTFDDCRAFCRWLSEKEGVEYDLPTEAQWEFAARGGNLSHDYFASGSNDVDKVAWYADNSGGELHPVGKKIANELGIHDMTGNVREWTLDHALGYRGFIYIDTLVNPLLQSRLVTYDNHVGRGSSSNLTVSRCRNSYRTAFQSAKHGAGLGFRIVQRTEPNRIYYPID